MPEPGGPTAQSGFLYQNSIAALYLGRLLDSREEIEARRVVSVRPEAPMHVDDFVVTYGDGALEYVQAKERIDRGRECELWQHVLAQYREKSFRPGRDRLMVWTSESNPRNDAWAEAARRAHGAESADEWEQGFSEIQAKEIGRIASSLAIGIDELRRLFASLTIEIASLETIERHKVRDWMPDSNRTRDELFSLLRGHVAGNARYRNRIDSETLRTVLASLQIRATSPRRTLEPFQIPPADVVGRDAEFERVAEWVSRPRTEAAIGWIVGEPGSGKSAFAAAVAHKLEAAGQLLLYYSFGITQGRSTAAFVQALLARTGTSKGAITNRRTRFAPGCGGPERRGSGG